MILALLACLAPRAPLPGDPLDTAVAPLPPDVVAASLDCDPETSAWTLSLTTSGWAGSVWSWWSADGVYVEDRAVPSASHAPDGTGEDFLLQLALVPDFRDLDVRTGTALSCGADPSVRVLVSDLDGQPWDCLDFPGGDLDWATVAEVPDCPGMPAPPTRAP